MARRRDYAKERRREEQLAKLRGFASHAEQRRYARRPSTLAELVAHPEAAREVRSDALRATDLALRERISVERAADLLGVPMSAVRWWAVERLGPTRHGRTFVTRRDALRLRPVAFVDSGRTEWTAVRGWKRKEAEKVFAIQWAAGHGMATDEELDWLRGRRVNGRLVADTQEHLSEIARRGELDPVDAYRGLVA